MPKRAAAIVVALVLGIGPPVHAASGRAPDQPLVVLTLAGQKDAEDVAFFSSVRALAAELGIAVTTQEVPTFQAVRDALLARARQESKPFLVAWIVREPSRRTIHLFDPWENHLRTRTVAAGGSAPANAETLALILRAELVAYLREAPAEPAPAAPPAPPAPPTPPAPPVPPLAALPVVAPELPRPAPRWGVSTAYAAGTLLRNHGLQHGVRIGLWHRWAHLRVGAQYALWPASSVHADDVSLSVARHMLELDAGLASAEHHRLRLGGEAYLAGELVARHTSSATAPLVAQGDDRRFGWTIGARARGELRLARALALFAALVAEAPLRPYDFQIARGTTTTTVARAAPVRVGGELGLTFWFF